jgi:hydrogenase maturation factor
VSKGLFIATVHRKELDNFMKILDEHEQSGEPIDLHEIDKIIKDEEK